LTRSPPLSRSYELPVYVARVPAAPFCETPTHASASDTDALQSSQDWDRTVPERDCRKATVIRLIKLSLSFSVCCEVVRLVGTNIALSTDKQTEGKYEADLNKC
jgi:hypothetical protein